MQRDYWYDRVRDPDDMAPPEQIAARAAERVLSQLEPRALPVSGQMPVVFRPELARSLLSHLCQAINGQSQYQQASFLLDRIEQSIFPDWVHIDDQPHLLKGLGSAPFDQDGLATYAKSYVQNGVLKHYILDLYSARRLGFKPNASAGGPFNLRIQSSGQTEEQLLSQMGRGVVLTQLMGMGINSVTGDYSQGASGFWVEEGHIQYPIDGLTVAGNLNEIYRQLIAVSQDPPPPGSIQTGAWLVDGLTVAGQSS